MTWQITEKKNPRAIHGVFDSEERADRFLKETIPVYVNKSFFMDKSLTADDFEVVACDSDGS